MATGSVWHDSLRPFLTRPVAAVCHDAGAAHLIMPWLEPLQNVRPVMLGPARKLWQRRFPERKLMEDLKHALDGADLLISGTGWASDIEHQSRLIARQRGVYCVGVIDHWVNYPQRFERSHKRCMPDELWVTDEYAYALATQSFPGLQVRLFDNRYLAEQVELAGSPPGHGHVLYVLEPIRQHWTGSPCPDLAGEWQALQWFISNRNLAGVKPNQEIRLRPHPSDPPGKYDHWLAKHSLEPIVLDSSADLAQALANCDVVAGCESMAMVVGLAAGRQVIGTLPPWGHECRLPHRGLIHLRSLTPTATQPGYGH